MLIIFWIICCVVVGVVRSARGGSFWALFLLSLVISPLLGLICAFAVPVKRQAVEKQQVASGQMKKCPDCAELVLKDAKVCRYCRHDFTGDVAVDLGPPPPQNNNVAYDVGARIGRMLRA